MKITLSIRTTLAEAKQAYRDHYYGGDKTIKVLKTDLEQFFSQLLEADIESVTVVKELIEK